MDRNETTYYGGDGINLDTPLTLNEMLEQFEYIQSKLQQEENDRVTAFSCLIQLIANELNRSQKEILLLRDKIGDLRKRTEDELNIAINEENAAIEAMGYDDEEDIQ